MGTNDSGANTSVCFPLSFFVSKLFLLNLLGILDYYLIKISPFAHIYQQSVAHAFTICGICSVFAITLIWIVLNYSQLCSCPVVSIIAIHFCMVLLTLTSQGFSVYRINWPTCDKVSSIYSQSSTVLFPSSVAIKIIVQDQFVDLKNPA